MINLLLCTLCNFPKSFSNSSLKKRWKRRRIESYRHCFHKYLWITIKIAHKLFWTWNSTGRSLFYNNFKDAIPLSLASNNFDDKSSVSLIVGLWRKKSPFHYSPPSYMLLSFYLCLWFSAVFNYYLLQCGLLCIDSA